MNQPTENEVDENFSKHAERSSFKEPIVLVGIIGLSILNGINPSQQFFRALCGPQEKLTFYSLSLTVGPIPGTIGMSFISEIKGRKPVLVTMFSLSILSSVLATIPYEILWQISCVIQGFVRGGALTITFLAISEYCCPRHRFAYLVANAAVEVSAYGTVEYLYSTKLLDATSVFLQLLMTVLGSACLLSTWVWPESPYWLASKGKLVESKRVFLWLRGEQSETEFRTLKQEQRRPGPPRLYWLPLIIAIITLSISQFNGFQEVLRSFIFQSVYSEINEPLVTIICTFVIGTILVVISYKVNRKLLFTVTSTVPLLLCYVFALWLYLMEVPSTPTPDFWIFFINGILLRLGLAILGMAVSIETIPLKYNTHMTCICFVVYYLIKILYYAILMRTFYYNRYVNILLFTTLSLCGVILFYFLSQDTKNKTLLEIQKSYTPKQNVTSPESEPIAMQHVQNERDELEI